MSPFSGTSHRTDPGPADVLAPDRPRRPVPRTRRRADVVDAVFEVVPAGRVPPSPFVNDNRRPVPADRTLPARRSAGLPTHPESRLRRLSLRAFVMLTACLSIAVFLAVAALSPAPRHAASLDIAEVTTVLADAGGLRVANIYGAVVNRTGEALSVPPIRVDLVSDGRPVRADGHWTGTGTIAPGETRRFSARVPHAGSVAPQVKISFAPTGAPPPGL